MVPKRWARRAVTLEMLEKASHDILQSLEQDFQREIPSHLIGTKVMDKLQATVPGADTMLLAAHKPKEGEAP
jgi:transcriptional regulator NrdR family protein